MKVVVGDTANRAVMVVLAIGLSCTYITGCGPTQQKQWEPAKLQQSTFALSRRQLPPEPTYRRATWVHSPQVKPSRELPQGAEQMIEPVVEIAVTRIPLKDFAKVLSSANGYSVYTASSIAGRRVTIRQLGTIDEIAGAVAKSLGIYALVDHQSRQISFFESKRVVPDFYFGGFDQGSQLEVTDKEVSGDGNQPTY